MRPTTNSATALAFLPGVLITITPDSVAALISIWLVAERHMAAVISLGAFSKVSEKRKSRSITTVSKHSDSSRLPKSRGSQIVPVSHQSS